MRTRSLTLVAVLTLFVPASLFAAAPSAAAAEAGDKLADALRQDGLLTLLVDKKEGKVFLQLPRARPDGKMAEVIHHTLMGEGVGSALLRLDRGQFGPSRLLLFRRVGNNVLAEYRNPLFVSSGGALEKRGVEGSFADSVVWSGEIVADRGDSVIVDISSFLTLDSNGMARTLNQSGHGKFKQNSQLSVVLADRARAFPHNDELDALITFDVESPTRSLSQLVPDARNVTVALHHSFIRLPDDGYVPRAFDPRTGEGEVMVTDFSAPLGDALVRHLARRFRLEKTDPDAARSTVKKPIVFYVDNTAPEPIRSALVEGAGWWKQAFEAAGLIDAYRVEVLPEGADSMDSRYNMIFWVHRQTRSWSYGQGVTDPRTGEIVRGSVLLGSQRIRQNILMFEGLFGTANTGKGGPNDPARIALARLRQLAAHEVGHALGFQHNFSGSGQGRTSVMDYPVAKVTVTDGQLDAGEAYAVGIGQWDMFTIDALYGDARALEERIGAGAARLHFGTDADGRADATGLAGNTPWDNGADAADELNNVMDVRRIALDRFGLDNLPEGAPVNDLRRRIVPVYLYQRYQVAAAAKLVGGSTWGYPVKGGGNEAMLIPVPRERQLVAVDALLRTLQPSELVFGPEQLKLLAAQNTGGDDPQFSTELIDGRLGRAFDAGMAEEVAAEITLSAMFAPERLNRMVEAEARDPQPLRLGEYLDMVIEKLFSPEVKDAAQAEAARRVQLRAALMLARHAHGVQLGTTPGAVSQRVDETLSPTALAAVKQRLATLGLRLEKSSDAYAQWLGGVLGDEEQLQALLQSGRYDVAIPPGEPI